MSSDRSIHIIIDKLANIEPMLTLMDRFYSKGNNFETKILAHQVHSELTELMGELDAAPTSVKCAEFSFMGSDYTIDYIIDRTRESIWPCLQLRSHNI